MSLSYYFVRLTVKQIVTRNRNELQDNLSYRNAQNCSSNYMTDVYTIAALITMFENIVRLPHNFLLDILKIDHHISNIDLNLN